MTAFRAIGSPLGPLRLEVSGAGLTGVRFLDELASSGEANALSVRSAEHLDHAEAELDAYFRGELERFTVAIDPRGTEFQRAVWLALGQIPIGETRSYGDIARSVGRPSAVRAVGLANGANPISIVVPCHRVIGSTGRLTGYGGGLERKRWLLEHEAHGAFEASLFAAAHTAD